MSYRKLIKTPPSTNNIMWEQSQRLLAFQAAGKGSPKAGTRNISPPFAYLHLRQCPPPAPAPNPENEEDQPQPKHTLFEPLKCSSEVDELKSTVPPEAEHMKKKPRLEMIIAHLLQSSHVYESSTSLTPKATAPPPEPPISSRKRVARKNNPVPSTRTLRSRKA
ncbi:hypothetical protein RSAG8_05796, partial [Rhizoctonia solani AG-8 WAC10335]